MDGRAPIYLSFAMQIHFRGASAEEELGSAHWNSPMGQQVRAWLLLNDLTVLYVDAARLSSGTVYSRREWHELTDKGRAWVRQACDTPLPVEKTEWVRG